MVDIERNGRTYHFALDIEKAIELEEKDGFNVFDGMDEITTVKGNPSPYGINRLTTAMLGYSLKDLLNGGFSLTELLGEDGIIVQVFRESGFISAGSAGATSQAEEGPSATE